MRNLNVGAAMRGRGVEQVGDATVQGKRGHVGSGVRGGGAGKCDDGVGSENRGS